MKNLGRFIRRIYRICSVYSQKAIKNYSLSTSEMEALRIITHHEGISQQGLADHMSIDKAAVTRLVASLEDKGYIHRISDENDRRLKRLYPTESGRLIKTELRATEHEFYEWIFSEISDEDMEVFARVMEMAFEKAVAGRRSGFGELNDNIGR